MNMQSLKNSLATVPPHHTYCNSSDEPVIAIEQLFIVPVLNPTAT